jgi:hypothetical protein
MKPVVSHDLFPGQTEKDTVKVIGFLKKEGGQREQEVASLQGQLLQTQETAATETRQLAQQCKSTVEEIEQQLKDRTEEVCGSEGTTLRPPLSLSVDIPPFSSLPLVVCDAGRAEDSEGVQEAAWRDGSPAGPASSDADRD